ncbi:elongator complex protein 4 [Nymphaea colorata]|nr:elongator complex protein 4 [Nymphaea colorata]XP_049933230.1 elongator complex protein 4 [Nymphaea colorata]XP_049933231.1 elongator complex protein 4 [Nymphaea colorata]
MATNMKSSFSRNPCTTISPLPSGVKPGPNGIFLVSTGISYLDKILGGGIPLGTLVMIMEDNEAPHHLLLLRNFMSQGLIHQQPLLYASPEKNPQAFLGTLPGLLISKSDKHESGSITDEAQEKNLRIAWQYKKYCDEQQLDRTEDGRKQYCSDFDLRKPLERKFLSRQYVDCMSIHDTPDLASIRERCFEFLAQFSRHKGPINCVGRVAIQSFCAPQSQYSNMDWKMLSFINSLRSTLRSSNAVCMITFPPSVLSLPFCTRWQHLADTLLSVKALPDEDKELGRLLTDYNEMVGLLCINKVCRVNSQVPAVLDSTTFSLKLQRRKLLVLECLNQAPVDGSGNNSSDISASCSGSSKVSSLDF